MSGLLEIGSSLLHYVVTEKIGSGGMGEVYKGHDKLLKRDVAIKVVKPNEANSKEFTQRFLSEARTLAQINHPSVTTIYEIQDDGEKSFIVMEYLEGLSLKEFIEEQRPTMKELFGYFKQAALGFSHIHKKGILHRDIKPANLFITKEGELKIIDFGIAKWEGDVDGVETSMSHFVGSLLYSAPEVFLLTRPDESSEVYSLGISLVNALIGRPLYDGNSSEEIVGKIKYEDPTFPGEFTQNVPEPLLEFLLLTIEKDKRDRIPNMEELVENIDRLSSVLSDEFLNLPYDALLSEDLTIKAKGIRKTYKKDGNIFTMTLDKGSLDLNKKKGSRATSPKKRKGPKKQKGSKKASRSSKWLPAVAICLVAIVVVGKLTKNPPPPSPKDQQVGQRVESVESVETAVAEKPKVIKKEDVREKKVAKNDDLERFKKKVLKSDKSYMIDLMTTAETKFYKAKTLGIELRYITKQGFKDLEDAYDKEEYSEVRKGLRLLNRVLDNKIEEKRKERSVAGGQHD